MTKKKRLGRGLDSLIPRETENKSITEVDITDVIPNKDQPRKRFEKEKLEELVESIKNKGVIQPIIVSKEGRNYVIIAGERRWRAAGLAGLHKIPVVVKDGITEKERLELAIIENIQREDLNAVELAKAYRNLINRYNYTQEELSKIMGKSRSAVANTIRILNLPEQVLEAVETNIISEGHARALVVLDNRIDILTILKKIIDNKLSVRETEKLVSKTKHIPKSRDIIDIGDDKDIFKKQIQEELENIFNTKVNIKSKKKGGTIEIKYSSEEELNRIITSLRGEDND
jgi:ParB family chromosome partitioning protein